MSFRHGLRTLLLPLALLMTTGAWAEGVRLEEPSRLARLVPAEQLEAQAVQDFAALKRKAAAEGALASPRDPQLQRLQAIAQRIIAQAGRYNTRALQWDWDVALIRARDVNAFCMPGGKIAFYTGLLEGLKLSDAEAASVMGHEVAHALREHARERIAKSQLTGLGTQLGAAVLGSMIGDGRYTDAIATGLQVGGGLLNLKFSRGDETEADVLGLELAARAGYDPQAAISLWEKMSAANRNAPPQWLSTHPSGKSRIREIREQLPQVMPLYEQARRNG